MKAILRFFYPKKELSYFDKLKSNAFIIIMLVGGLIALIMALFGFIVRPANYLFIIRPSLIFLLLTIFYLFLLKYTNIKTAGNIASLLSVIVIAISVNIINTNFSVLYKYMGGFYTLIGLFASSVLFASPSIIIINTLIILGTVLRIHFYTINHYSELHDLANSALANRLASLLLVFIFFYLTQNFTEKALKEANKIAQRNHEQNKILITILKNIEDSSEEIFTTSELLSETSQKLSENATEQAATTEEISASMEEMLASIQSNTEKSEYTSKISTDAAEKMRQNKELIIKALNSVNNISQIITEISVIADKTDILSINAAIEAARAGESGKGFAVVAQEIRKLADHTQNLAQEITNLSVKNIELSQKASEQLEQIIPEIIKSAEMVKNITVASKEQESNIEAINNAVLQLSNSTNENSASSQELSASAEQLLAQAQKLKELSTSFKSFI